MQGKKVFMAITAMLFAVVAALTLFMWHSLYLYGGAVLTGYAALLLLTVILKGKMHFQNSNEEQLIRSKTRFYRDAIDIYGIFCLLSLFLSLLSQRNAGLCFIMVIVNIAVAIAAFTLTVRCCENSDWRIWLSKAILG